MPLGFIPYSEQQEAQDITRLGADMRVSMQSERLSGTGSLLTATERDMDTNLQNSKIAKKNNWLLPAIAVGFLLIGIGVVKI
jgi:hypothetical protein